MPHPGPAELGRGVVVLPGGEVPEPWTACPRVPVGEAELADPRSVTDQLHQAWLERRPVVVELAADQNDLRAPERHDGPVHHLAPSFEFTVERLHFLVWANTYDARSGQPIWWHGRKAARRFAGRGVTEGDTADLVLADGTPLYVDGGPPDPPAVASGTGVVHRWTVEAGHLRPTLHRAPAAELAPDQREAVGHPAGPARVIAPAGSGKTRVLTERLRHLVGDRGVDPGTVSALAYNTRAADELKQRCAEILTSGGPHIRTLNSTGLWICTEYGPAGRPRVLEESGVRELLQSTFEIRRQANADTVAPYISALSAIRLGLRRPAAVEEELPDAEGIAEGFDRYRSALAAAGSVDFDEQIYRAIEILLTDPDARRAAQTRCRRLLVDEFQDLTPAHLLLIRLLAAPGYDCFGVGDDDQVIYGYAGATPEFLIDFPRYFPGAAHHPLEVNYRCPPAVVAAAGHLLSYNTRRIDKTLRTPAHRSDAAPEVGGPLGRRRAGGGALGPGGTAGRIGHHRHHRLAGPRRRPGRDRRPGPGQFDPAPSTGGVYGGRPPLVGAARGGRPGPDRYAHRVRLSPDRLRSGPHPAGGRPGHHPATVPGHRPHGGGHGDQTVDHLGRRHPAAGRPPVGTRRTEIAGLRRRPRRRGHRLPAGRRPPRWRSSGTASA